MRCTEVTYSEDSEKTGVVNVVFTINENGTNMVSVATLEDLAGARPDFVHAYSPAGAVQVRKEDFKKGETVIYSGVKFSGNMDLSPWMALVFPLRFESDVQQEELTLKIPDAKVSYQVENGTWADGSTEPQEAAVEMTRVAKLDEEGNHTGYVLTGTITEDMLPTGMLAHEGYDQESGKWSEELSTEENGFVIELTRAAAGHFTYSFDELSPEEEKPGETEKPGEEEKPGETVKPGEENKPADEEQEASGSQKPASTKPAGKVPTAVAAGIAGFIGLQTAAAAAFAALLKRRKK